MLSEVNEENLLVYLTQNNKIEPVTQSAQMRAAGVQVPPCASPVGISTAEGAVCRSATCCRGETELYNLLLFKFQVVHTLYL